ncbi:hypothetical protein WME89_29410 [Sorangium sp. So ce321]|uniref:hypothetical protein n=1 Tax=Sorangium sp. So ce321 TaxID=3133300 RepID=UPI003F6066C6
MHQRTHSGINEHAADPDRVLHNDEIWKITGNKGPDEVRVVDDRVLVRQPNGHMARVGAIDPERRLVYLHPEGWTVLSPKHVPVAADHWPRPGDEYVNELVRKDGDRRRSTHERVHVRPLGGLAGALHRADRLAADEDCIARVVRVREGKPVPVYQVDADGNHEWL